MNGDPITAHDWIKMTMKFPGYCLICKQRINSGEMGYWSRIAKSILHEDCYNHSGLDTKQNQNSLNNKTDRRQKNADSLLPDFIAQRQNKEKCFVCGNKVEFRDSLILTLLKLDRNIGIIETFFCSTCLSRSDLNIFEEYKHAFSKNLKFI